MELTPEGRAAHGRVASAVGDVRRHVAAGVSAEEYDGTMEVLSRMVENLQRALGKD